MNIVISMMLTIKEGKKHQIQNIFLNKKFFKNTQKVRMFKNPRLILALASVVFAALSIPQPVTSQCYTSTVFCDNGKEIVRDKLCNNYDDCGDNSDEVNCPQYGSCSLLGRTFQCDDGTCIYEWQVCDGMRDCSRGEDECLACYRDVDGGCFPPDAKVLTPHKNVTMENLEIGTPVLVMGEGGRLTYSQVIAFLDRNAKLESKYTTIETEDGNSITLTRSHLIYKANYANTSQILKLENVLPVFASKLKINDYIFTRSTQGNKVRPSKIVKISNTKKAGLFAPLTLEGTIIVDGALASCYAVVDDHRLAHTTLAPLRFLYRSMPSLLRERQGEMLTSWYPALLESVGRMVLDETHFHPSTVKHIVREN